MTPEEQLQKLLIDGQTRIFQELDEIKITLNAVAVQKNEIEHINETLENLKAVDDDHERRIKQNELTCLKQHGPSPSLVIRVRDNVVIAVVVGGVIFALSVFGFLVMKTLPEYFDFQHTQINAEKGR